MMQSIHGTSLAAAALLAIWLTSATARAQGPDPLPLWPQGAPGATGSEDADKPTLRAYLPEAENATGAAIVICPGGGYGTLAMDHEGHQIARWLNSHGIAGCILKYRHAPRYRHPAPLNDAQRAMRFVRSRAKQWKLDPERIGIMGFSAGGHLASTAATHFDLGDADSEDPIEQMSCRPDFAILAYPVISFRESFAHAGSRRNLLGADPTPELVNSLSNETQITPQTPPAFLFHTAEDPVVPVQNSVAFFLACQEAGVPAELHVYRFGPHGVGLAPADPVTTTWKERLLDWLRVSGFLARVERAAVEGSVRVGGQPLRWGMISFRPEETSDVPSTFALVANGRFEIPTGRGAAVGPCRIELYDLGSVVPRPTVDDATRLDENNLSCDIKSGANRIVVEVD
jgi:acetyl esterase/lipase